MADFQVNAVVVCDDIRREVTQKDILIGVYGSEIIIHTLPAQVSLAFWIELVTNRRGTLEILLKVDVPSQRPSVEIRMFMETVDGQQIYSVFTPPFIYFVEKEGKLRLLAKTKQGGRYDVIKERRIRYMPIPTQNIQPSQSSATDPARPVG